MDVGNMSARMPDTHTNQGITSWIPLVAVCLAMFIVVLDSTMMNVAISAIVDDLDTNVSAVQGGISLYSLVMASFMVAGAKLGDILGTKRVYIIALIVYGIGTIMAALSPHVAILILGWSIMEGLAAAALIPISMALIVVNYKGSQRAFAFGALGGFAATASAVGPIFGGFLTTTLSWRWGFGFEVLIVIAVLLLFQWVKGSEPRREQSLDVVGVILSAAGFAFIVIGTLIAGRYGWWEARRPFTIGEVEISLLGLSPVPFMLLLGLCFLVAFVHWQRRRQERGQTPLIHLSIFRNPQYVAGVSVDALESLAIAGVLFLVPVYLQTALGFDALETGLALLPLSAAVFITSLATPRLGARVAPKLIVQAGIVLMGVGILWYREVASPDLTASALVLPFIVFGAGVGLLLAQVTNITLSAVPEEESGEASGAYNSAKELGTAIGVAVLGSILLISFFANFVDQAASAARVELPADEREAIAIELEDAVEKFEDPAEFEAELRRALPAPAEERFEELVDAGMVDANKDALMATFGVVVICLLASTFLKGGRPRREQPPGYAHEEATAEPPSVEAEEP